MASLMSSRGYGAVLATCDTARSREAVKELLNLLQQAFETLYPIPVTTPPTENAAPMEPVKVKSMQEMLDEEVKSIKSDSKVKNKLFCSVDTNTKGVVFVIVNKDHINARDLVIELFARISREKRPISRHLVRIIPFQKVCYPNEDELKVNLSHLIQTEFPTHSYAPKLANNALSSEGDEQPSKKVCADHINKEEEIIGKGATPSSKVYAVDFKARNHDTLKKDYIYDLVASCMPLGFRVDYKKPQVPRDSSSCITFCSLYGWNVSVINISSAVY